MALLAALAFAEALVDPTRQAIGHPANDVWNHVWGYWWVARELAGGELPLHTDLLNWPTGGSLWFIDAFGAVATLPVQFLFGPVAAYNVANWAQLWLCGIGAYVLALRVSGSWAGAFAAGVAYMSSPHLLAQAYNGISETLAAGWLPLAITAMLAAAESPTPQRGALAGLTWACTVLANWYYGLFAGMALGAIVLNGVWGWWPRRLRGADWLALRRGLVTIGGGVLVGAGIAAWPFALFVSSMHADDAVVTRNPGFVWMTLIFHNMTDAVTLVRPGKYYSPDLKAVFDEDLIVVVYIGHALLWPALAVLASRQRKLAWPWVVFAAIFLLFTLGPYLYVAGDYVQFLGGWIPLPFLGMFHVFPMFDRVAHAYRFIIGVYLALSVMLALAIRAARMHGLPEMPVVAAILVSRVVETAAFSPAVLPVPASTVDVHPAYAGLDGGAVLDLPVGLPVLSRSTYMIAQIVHQQPVPYGLNDPTPPYIYYNHYGQYLLELERSTVALTPPRLPWLDIELGRREMARRGLRWIVLHLDSYPKPQAAKLAKFLDLTATPHYADESLRVYRLDP
ncbi:MAG: hypothetical protein FJ090_10230 [Deltaproteobacteria bacterium]|nr:hypothetical protein [Deltaproteobacteria bacterium]